MIIRSVNEIVVHLESFRNIDLVFQGIYTLKVCVFEQLPNGKKIYAHPYEFTESYTQPLDSNFVCTPRTDTLTSTFFSKSFYVRFYEEEIDMNDICSFRIQFEISEHDNPRLQIEVSLLFYDHMANKSLSLSKQQITPSELERKVKSESKVIQTKTFLLSNVRQPTHSFWPLLFNDHYFCEVGMIVHSSCVDYRFRVSDIQLSEYVKLTSTERAKILYQNKKIDKKGFSIASSVSKSLGIEQQVLSNQILVIEEILINQFKLAYQKLFTHFQIMSTKCILDKDKSKRLKDAMLPSSLILPSEDSSLLKLPTHQRLSAKYKSIYPDTLITNILNESNLISSQLVLLWNQVLELYKISPKLCRYMLQYNWANSQRQIWNTLIQRKIKIGSHFEVPVEVNQFQKDRLFEEMRLKKVKQQMWDIKFFPNPDEAPMMFEHLYLRQKAEKQQQTPIQYKGIHLFVLVHGFQGTSQDMKLIRNYILYLHPQALLLSSSVNQDQLDTDIEVLGVRLANQVKSYINQNCPQQDLGRLSFIGYSMGGLKIRAALPLLSQYKDIMHSFITFSTPHLGLLYHSSSIVNAGIWFYNKMWNSVCLKQMSLTDANNIEDTFIYKLAFMEGIGWFKHVLLLASRQDDYAPYESARIQICKEAMSDKKNGQSYQQMAKRLTECIKGGRLHRLDVSFYIKERTFSSLIGRAAHIMFLDSHTLMKTILFNFKQFFD